MGTILKSLIKFRVGSVNVNSGCNNNQYGHKNATLLAHKKDVIEISILVTIKLIKYR